MGWLRTHHVRLLLYASPSPCWSPCLPHFPQATVCQEAPQRSVHGVWRGKCDAWERRTSTWAKWGLPETHRPSVIIT